MPLNITIWLCPSCSSANAPAMPKCHCGAAKPVYGLKDAADVAMPGKRPSRPSGRQRERAEGYKSPRVRGEAIGEFCESFRKLIERGKGK